MAQTATSASGRGRARSVAATCPARTRARAPPATCCAPTSAPAQQSTVTIIVSYLPLNHPFRKKKSFIVIFIITKSNLRFFELNLSTDPVGAPLSLIVATESGVERVWPAAPAAAARGNYSLAALDVRAIDFLYSNRCVTPAYSAARSGPCRTYATELTRRVSVRRSVCYVHRNVSRAALVCVDADDFSRRRELPAPHPLPDLDCEPAALLAYSVLFCGNELHLYNFYILIGVIF